MAKIFDEILLKGIRAGQIPAREQKAREWFRTTAKKVKTVNESQLMREADKDRLRTVLHVGHMYHFFYDPKHKAKLPYYDAFPLIFPYKKIKGGFMGLNMHYLPPAGRAQLMDALYETTNNQRYDESTKLNLSYQLLNEAAKYKAFKPCIKHYLKPHVRSRFLWIYPSEWDVALFLPTCRFEKASKTKVWADSMSKF